VLFQVLALIVVFTAPVQLGELDVLLRRAYVAEVEHSLHAQQEGPQQRRRLLSRLAIPHQRVAQLPEALVLHEKTNVQEGQRCSFSVCGGLATTGKVES
jgi:hypothetical protein